MARVPRPERPDLVFVSLRRGQGLYVREDPKVDSSSARNLAIWGVGPDSACPVHGDPNEPKATCQNTDQAGNKEPDPSRPE